MCSWSNHWVHDLFSQNSYCIWVLNMSLLCHDGSEDLCGSMRTRFLCLDLDFNLNAVKEGMRNLDDLQEQAQ